MNCIIQASSCKFSGVVIFKVKCTVTFHDAQCIVVCMTVSTCEFNAIIFTVEVEPVCVLYCVDFESICLQLLERVFNIMRQRNPKMVGGQKKKLVMKPPQVVRVGAKKTSFVNFTEICKQ